MALKLITPPATEPVSLAEVKTHLRVDITDDDDLITALVVAAREYCEAFQNRAYITQTWELTLDEFPETPLVIPKPPLQSVSSVKYIDYEGTETVFDAANYIVDTSSEPGRLTLAYGVTWPTVTLQRLNGVKITFTAGYGDSASDVPQTVKQAILLLVGHWYENREASLVGSVSREIEFAVHALLWPERVVPV